MSACDFAELTHAEHGTPPHRWLYSDSFAVAEFLDQADVAPLAFRHIILWHDNDPPSRTAMTRLEARLRGAARTLASI